MKAIVEKPFSGAPDGAIHPKDFVKGDAVEGDLARVAVQEGWARVEKLAELPLLKGDAPENKALGNAPENKESARDPLDHDGDGRKGGSKPRRGANKS